MTCTQCFHRCSIPEGGRGYCGIRRAENGKLRGGTPQEGNLTFYHDPLPTNCVNDRTLSNVEYVSAFVAQRPDPPLMIASTLLVPGYVDTAEVSMIARFFSRLNPLIPYRLLAFHPDFRLSDLPPTSRGHAQRCRDAAEKAGLQSVSVGNIHLLRNYYP